MLVLSVKELRKDYGTRTVFQNVSFEIYGGEKTALFGPNGAGKTTILEIITGLQLPDGGRTFVAPGVSLGFLPQTSQFEPGLTLAEACSTGSFLTSRSQGEALRRFGFAPESSETPVDRLSAGERTRLGLARLWMASPRLVLLDEPTNHLDIEGMKWLTRFLNGYDGTVLVVSHDRYFLDQTVSRVIELSPGGARSFSGNYSAYRRQKKAEFEAQAALYEQQQREEHRIEQLIAAQMEWFRKAHRDAGKQAEMRASKYFYRARAKRMARRAKATIHRLERMKSEQVEKPRTPDQMNFSVGASGKSGRRVVLAEGLEKSFGRLLFSDVNLSIMRGDRIGIAGPNGCGKTTLLRTLLGHEIIDEGTVWMSPTASPYYFDQELEELDNSMTVLESVVEGSTRPPDEVRSLLGAMLFSGDSVTKRVGVLSRGERVRVALARLLAGDHRLLALDEPTNNLDVDSREAVEECLARYEGTLIVISHDRYLLERVCNRIVAFDAGRVTVFNGRYSEFEPLEAHASRPAQEASAAPRLTRDEVIVLRHRLAVLSARLNDPTQSGEEKQRTRNEFIETARRLGQRKD